MTRVSIVMSTYNDAAYLPETIESVLRQSLGDFEFIIVNDGSPDPDTGEILESYARSDKRIRVLAKKNKGLTRALIEGCDIATGQAIARIDVGDVMQPTRLEQQWTVLEEFPQCSFVSCHTEFNGPEWEPMWIASGVPDSPQPMSVITANPDFGIAADIPHHGSVMMRKSAYESAGGYRSSFYCGQDWDLWYRLAELGDFLVVPEVLYRARIFPGSISMTRKPFQDESAICSLEAFKARRRNEDETPWLKRVKEARPLKGERVKKTSRSSKEQGFYFVAEALRRGRDVRCRKYFIEGIWHAPMRARNYIRLAQTWLPAGPKESWLVRG